jgi:hypothetical protein
MGGCRQPPPVCNFTADLVSKHHALVVDRCSRLYFLNFLHLDVFSPAQIAAILHFNLDFHRADASDWRCSWNLSPKFLVPFL